MKLLYNSLCIAFSMYSAIPMPQADWDKRNMRYAFCFFPLVGLVIGGLLCGWLWLCERYSVGMALRGAVAAAIPLLLSGGIHMDGFCDTVDALSSHMDTEKRLKILKDPHVGAFGVIGCGVYLLLDFGLWSQLSGPRLVGTAALGFALSRALSALAVISFPCAKQDGLAADFSNAADGAVAGAVLLAEVFLCTFWMLRLDLLAGGLACAAAVAVLCYYKRVSQRCFGGITGDLAGWFLQLCEFWMLAAVVLSGFWKGAF